MKLFGVSPIRNFCVTLMGNSYMVTAAASRTGSHCICIISPSFPIGNNENSDSYVSSREQPMVLRVEDEGEGFLMSYIRDSRSLHSSQVLGCPWDL